jgi:hypothetical protein
VSTTMMEGLDFDALETDVRKQVTHLREARARLSLGALKDDAVRGELRDVEGQLAEAEAELDRIEVARAEQERERAEAARDAEREAREKALARARELQRERQRAARSVDSGLQTFAHAIADYQRICFEQEAALSRAGRQGGQYSDGLVQAALRHYMLSASVPRAPFDLPPDMRKVQPLADADPVWIVSAREEREATERNAEVQAERVEGRQRAAHEAGDLPDFSRADHFERRERNIAIATGRLPSADAPRRDRRRNVSPEALERMARASMATQEEAA